MGCCNPNRNNKSSFENCHESEQRNQDEENWKKKCENIQEEYEKYKESNRSSGNSSPSVGSISSGNSSLSEGSGNSQEGQHLIKVTIRFKDADYQIQVKRKYDLMKILSIFRKQTSLSPFGKFKYKGEEKGLCTKCKELGLNEGDTIDLE